MGPPSDAIDLDAYFRRIGYAGPREPTLPVLRDLARLHTLAIPFENLDPLLGRPIGLDAASLEAKLVRGGRGGYCFEQNTLLQLVLRTLGFEAKALAARVLLNAPEGAITPRTHVLLRVEAEGRSYLADVGFGRFTPTGPLLFEADFEQETPHERYRIAAAAEEFELFVKIADAWTRLYRFHLIEHLPIDLEVNNHFVATWPRSFFRNAVIAARPVPHGRHLLYDGRLTFQHPDGRRDEHMLADADAVIAALTDVFGIAVPDVAGVKAIVGRIIAVR